MFDITSELTHFVIKTIFVSYSCRLSSFSTVSVMVLLNFYWLDVGWLQSQGKVCSYLCMGSSNFFVLTVQLILYAKSMLKKSVVLQK